MKLRQEYADVQQAELKPPNSRKSTGSKKTPGSNGRLNSTGSPERWNPRARARFPASFMQAYPTTETAVISPENYMDWLV
ncbi:hypothetical protein [Spirosoma areae]